MVGVICWCAFAIYFELEMLNLYRCILELEELEFHDFKLILTPLMIGNKYAINLAKNLVSHGMCKHIETIFHILRDQFE
jgi:hypothetical protein